MTQNFNDFMYNLVYVFRIGLSPLAKDVRVFLHNHTLRFDIFFNRIPSDFNGHPRYIQSIILYGIIVFLTMVLCLYVVYLFHKKAPSIKTMLQNYLIWLKVFEWTVIGLAAIVAVLGALALLGFIISNFYLLRIKWKYSNPAANHIYSFHSMLNTVNDIIKSMYTTIMGLINRIVNIDIAPLKSSIGKVDKLIPYIQKQLITVETIFRTFWVVQYALIFVEAIVIIAGITMNIMSILAVVRRAPKLLKFLRITSLGMLIIWWMLSVVLTPIALALSDVCVDPVTGISTVTDTIILVPKGLLPYYLGCKGWNPLGPPFFLLRTGLYAVSLAVRGILAVLTPFVNLFSMENVKPVLEILKQNMLILDMFTKNHLQTSCEWSGKVFKLAADDVCSGVLLGLILTLLGSFFMGLVLTFFVVLSLFAGEQVVPKRRVKKRVKRRIKKKKGPHCLKKSVEQQIEKEKPGKAPPKNATVAIQANIPLRKNKRPLVGPAGEAPVVPNSWRRTTNITQMKGAKITRTARTYTVKCEWDIHMFANHKNHPQARQYRPKHRR